MSVVSTLLTKGIPNTFSVQNEAGEVVSTLLTKGIPNGTI